MDIETLILKWVLILCGIPLLAVFGYLHWTMQRESQEKERERLREEAWKSHWTPEMREVLDGYLNDPVVLHLSANPKLYKSYTDARGEYVLAWRQERVPPLWAQIMVGAHRDAYRRFIELKNSRTKPARWHAEVVRRHPLLLPPAEK